MGDRIYRVEQISQYIRQMFASDYLLRRLSVQGEISNCKYHSSGHIYFTLKDEKAQIACVMFAGDRAGLGFRMKDGDQAVVTGSVSVYARDGKYQLYAKKIELVGAGLLYERFLARKAELEEMGMFAQEYKQPVPFYVRRLGIVTAPTGAAVQDIRNIALRRNPFIQLILYPAQVQGEGAAASIAAGIRVLDAMGLDCLIVGRGGGSIEDLWAFNETEVAQAIFDADTPIISAVGHETDTTIADFVADLRAPTPSAAAELAVADVAEILRHLSRLSQQLDGRMQGAVSRMREKLTGLEKQWQLLSPEGQLRDRRQRLADLEDDIRSLLGARLTAGKNTFNMHCRALQGSAEAVLRDRQHRLELLIRQLDGLSPLKKLSQGYAWVETEEGKHVAGIGGLAAGDRLLTRLLDGVVRSTVESVEPSAQSSE